MLPFPINNEQFEPRLEEEEERGQPVRSAGCNTYK